MTPAPEVVDVDTPGGLGRWHISRASAVPRVRLALGHGAGGGIESADLAALAKVLPQFGIEVCRFEQPWRVAGRRVAGPPAGLDAAWTHALPEVIGDGAPLVLGGRSAGARVACRTAAVAGAVGVLLLAFPLHPPGRPDRSRADELPLAMPLLVVQGSRDPFGTPADLRPLLADGQEVLEIPGGDHSLKVARTGDITSSEAIELVVLGVRRWLVDLRGASAGRVLRESSGATGALGLS
jgi:predicted alpha/beta-hydrolase family hydrolase